MGFLPRGFVGVNNMLLGQFVNAGDDRWQHLPRFFAHGQGPEPFDHGFGGFELVTITQSSNRGLSNSLDGRGVIGHIEGVLDDLRTANLRNLLK